MSNLPKKLNPALRYGNTKGKIIPMHHAFKTLHLNRVSRVSAVVLPVLFMALVWLFLPWIFDVWDGIFNFWLERIYHMRASYWPVNILGQDLAIPYPALEADAPSHFMVQMNFWICLLVLAISIVFPLRGAPLTYLLRTALLIQGSASIDRMVSPDFFPYTLPIYLLDAMIQCVYMLFLIPVILGFVYYIFDFTIWRKVLITCLTIGYFLIAVPCQYMLHAYFIHEWTLLFLPLMYILFGIVIDVLMFVSIYSYGMSWRSRKEALQGRGL